MLLTASSLRASYLPAVSASPHLCQSDAVKRFRGRKGLLPLSSFWRKALDKSFDRKDDNGVFAITSGSTIKCVTVVTAQAACPAAAYVFEYAAANACSGTVKINSRIIFDPVLRIYLLCILLPYFLQSKTPISKPINRRPVLSQNMPQRRVRLQRRPQRPFARPIQMLRTP